MSFINVRYPTGHLEVIPVQINAPLIKAHEAACAKRSLDAKSFKLIHKKKTIDLSTSFRYSGLLNHANVELVPCEGSTSTTSGSSRDVRVGFRLDDGHRTQWTGPVNSSIWDILEHIATTDERVRETLQTTSDLVPTIIYIQQPIGGEAALRGTTLESLGIHDSVLFKLDRRPSPAAPSPVPLTSTAAHPKPAPSASPEPAQIMAPSVEDSSSSTQPAPPPALATRQPTSYSQMPQGESASFIFTGTAAGPTTSTGLAAEPFSIFGIPPTRSIFDASNEPSRPKYERPATMGELFGVSLEPDDNASQGARVPAHLRNFRFPTETAGQNLMDDDADDRPGTSNPGAMPCEREDILFQRIISTTSDTDSEELPDEFFQITEGELRLIISGLRKVAGTDTALGEHAIQRAARERLYARYPRCIIKFVWCDDVVLQACFRPLEPISALYDFIRSRLVDNHKPFQLFTTPPKIILSSMSDSLTKAHLVPMAKIHMTTPNGSPRAREILRADVLESMETKSALHANEVASKWMAQRPKP